MLERQALSNQLLEAREALKTAEAKASQVEGLQSRLDEAIASKEVQDSELATTLLRTRALAGLAPVAGPGLTVTLEDGPSEEEQENPELALVHDVNLADLVNELWAAGAEAISINGQRITVRSPVRCAGPVILINAKRVAAPYTVTAVGPVEELSSGLKMPGGWLASMEPLLEAGGRVTIEPHEQVVVPGFGGPLPFNHGQPVSPSEGA